MYQLIFVAAVAFTAYTNGLFFCISMIPLAVLLTSLPAGSRDLVEFGFFYDCRNNSRFFGVDMNLLHHCTIELFLTVVIGGTITIIVTVLTMDR